MVVFREIIFERAEGADFFSLSYPLPGTLLWSVYDGCISLFQGRKEREGAEAAKKPKKGNKKRKKVEL